MKLSRKFRILKKLYFFSRISQDELDACDDHMVNQVKEEMQKKREENSRKIHEININDLLSDNDISRSLD